MTAHSLNLTWDRLVALDTFVVFDMEDPANASVCFGEEQTRETISYWKDPSVLRVRRITEDEPARDVTAQFILPPDDETDWDYHDGSLQQRERPHLVTSPHGHRCVRDGGV